MESGFTSYIDDHQLATISLTDDQKTKILDGETVVSEIKNVRLYSSSSNRCFVTGDLTVTTFKLSFASADEDRTFTEKCCQQNNFLGINDVCLSAIDVIYSLGDRTRKKLIPGQSVSTRMKKILIICKNMRTFEFRFSADNDGGKNIVNAIMHHAFPKRHDLLFAYEFKEPYYANRKRKDAIMFRVKKDWEEELMRKNCTGNWRISTVNESYEISFTMMSTFIVPKSLSDSELTLWVEHFRNRYCPVWVWGTAGGAALVRMSHLLPTIQDSSVENSLFEKIRASHPKNIEASIIDLTKHAPSPKDIQSSYLKLRELCIPAQAAKISKTQDYKFYSLLESTKWLTHVSIFLTKAVEAAETLQQNKIVVLQEGDGHDANCIVSSLIQLILDPFFRTKFGFQSLVQKEWVAMGHPFTNRLGHILSKSSENEQSPVFLLFLDCVWQLTQQYPTVFQFNETYLTSIWDTAHVAIFDTFLFMNQHHRERQKKLLFNIRSAWDWKEQFSDKDIRLFCNPLYNDRCDEVLKPQTKVCHLEIWLQCYFRWLPDLEISCGGRPQIDLCSRILVQEILALQVKEQAESNGVVSNGMDKEGIFDLLRKVNSFFPFSRNNSEINASLSSNNVFLTGDMFETQSLINFNND